MRGCLWFVSEIYYPDETSTGFVVTHLAEAAVRTRVVRVLCGQPRYDRRGSNAPRVETRNGILIERCRGTTFSKDSLLGRIVNSVTITLSMMAIAGRRFRRGDLVLVTTNPPVMPFVMTGIARARGCRILVLVHDVYPEAMIAAGMISRTSLLARAIARVNARVYRTVNAVAVCGRDMASLVLDRAGPRAPRLGLVRNWADIDVIVPLPRRDNPLLRQLGLTDRFVVQYAGNMGQVHDIESIVDAAEAISKIHAEVHFLFIGTGSKLPWLQSEATKRGMANVTILGPQPRDTQATFLNACDVAITAFVPGMFGAGVPSRMYNVLAAAKPWIAAVDPRSEIGLVIREEDVGWVVPPGDTQGLISAIVDAFERPNRLAEMGRRGRDAVEQKYSFAATLRSLEALLSEMEGAT